MDENEMMKQFEKYMEDKKDEDLHGKAKELIEHSMESLSNFVMKHAIENITNFEDVAESIEAIATLAVIKHIMEIITKSMDDDIKKEDEENDD